MPDAAGAAAQQRRTRLWPARRAAGSRTARPALLVHAHACMAVQVTSGGCAAIHTADMRRAVSISFYPEGYDWVESTPAVLSAGYAGKLAAVRRAVLGRGLSVAARPGAARAQWCAAARMPQTSSTCPTASAWFVPAAASQVVSAVGTCAAGLLLPPPLVRCTSLSTSVLPCHIALVQWRFSSSATSSSARGSCVPRWGGSAEKLVLCDTCAPVPGKVHHFAVGCAIAGGAGPWGGGGHGRPSLGCAVAALRCFGWAAAPVHARTIRHTIHLVPSACSDAALAAVGGERHDPGRGRRHRAGAPAPAAQRQARAAAAAAGTGGGGGAG